jgi:hypothetical protein
VNLLPIIFSGFWTFDKVLFFGMAATLSIFLWRRHPSPAAARFDASEAIIQKLDLT